MADPTYTPPEVWTNTESGGRFASINRPTAGAREDKDLPRGSNPFQLHSLATPNGVKVTIMLEELLEKGHTGAEYDAYTVNIGAGQQFTSGFVAINPNSKTPAMIDASGDTEFRIFESGAILVHLAEKFDEFLPKDPAARAEVLSWVFFQVGTGPFIGGGFGHFYAYAPEKFEYPINRYAMESKRQLDVLDQQLATRPYIAGDAYTIADMAIWSWYGQLVLGRLYNAAEFLDVASYKNVLAWAERIDARPAVKRGRMVNRMMGDPSEQLHERHSAEDFETKTQDKIAEDAA